jgi:glyoxylase-like metal-dependent hydrolase (beta-lactamase superfamily II)
MASLRRLLLEEPGRIYPAHGPCIDDGPAKIREYLAHRDEREAQIVGAMSREPATVPEIVARVYTDVPRALHKAAELSVSSHLLKLEDEGRAARRDPHGDARKAEWSLV